MHLFVDENSVVRKIWGKGDTILFIFAGSAAEFALNKAVDWLYFTGRLPADPLGRLFSTVSYARQIVFSDLEAANYAIDKMAAIHAGIEASRGTKIPDWAYRDVLFMLIDYSIRSFELLERKLSPDEKAQVFNVFYRVGKRMGLKDLPPDLRTWLPMRKNHLKRNLQRSTYTFNLYKQYKKHLGTMRYYILLESQKLVVPGEVNKLLNLGSISLLTPLLWIYKISRRLKIDWFLKSLILPKKYKEQIRELDSVQKN